MASASRYRQPEKTPAGLPARKAQVTPSRRGAPSQKELVLSAAAAADGHREAAGQARQMAQVRASKAQDLEAEIVNREEELLELRRKLAEVRNEELRLLDLAEAQDAEAVAAEADLEEAATWSPEITSPAVSSANEPQVARLELLLKGLSRKVTTAVDSMAQDAA